MERYTILRTRFGSAGIVAADKGLSRIVLTGKNMEGFHRLICKLIPEAQYEKQLLPSLQRQLKDYFSGKPVHFRVKLDLSSLADFQRKVLQACARIEYGQTISYGELAGRIGKPKAARAVGGALARNPIPIVIPCHRVIAGDGSMGGFSAEQGIKLKRQLLKMEQRNRR